MARDGSHARPRKPVEKEIGLAPGNVLRDIPPDARLRVVSGKVVLAVSFENGDEPWWEEIYAGEFSLTRIRKTG